MPNLIGGIILGYIWMLLLNGILAHWGRALTYSATYGFWGLVILVCWQQIGYMMIIYIAGMQSLRPTCSKRLPWTVRTAPRPCSRSSFR